MPNEAMIYVSGGEFLMGSDCHYPEEGPTRRVKVDPFRIDRYPVTNAQFSRFVAATGWITKTEQLPNAADYPGIQPDMLKAGSLLFTKPAGPVALQDYTAWWSFCFGASWHQPYGPGSDLEGLQNHPVVHIAYEDAAAYAAWAGKSLPTEAEWEFAAWGGLSGQDYAWGSELAPDGRMMANYWQGAFPWENLALDGYERTSPVGTFPANGYDLYDMIGNVWEWTEDWYADDKGLGQSSPCCVPHNPRGGHMDRSYDPCQPDVLIGRKVLKGGSHLCAENYCQRYRPAARYAQPIDTSTSHVGFRCVERLNPDGSGV